MTCSFSFTQAGGKWYNVETGRRDGLVSFASEAVAGLPGPTMPVNIAIQEHAKRNLTAEDFVILLGTHRNFITSPLTCSMCSRQMHHVFLVSHF